MRADVSPTIEVRACLAKTVGGPPNNRLQRTVLRAAAEPKR